MTRRNLHNGTLFMATSFVFALWRWNIEAISNATLDRVMRWRYGQQQNSFFSKCFNCGELFSGASIVLLRHDMSAVIRAAIKTGARAFHAG
jgi:hypothetical protein